MYYCERFGLLESISFSGRALGSATVRLADIFLFRGDSVNQHEAQHVRSASMLPMIRFVLLCSTWLTVQSGHRKWTKDGSFVTGWGTKFPSWMTLPHPGLRAVLLWEGRH